MLRMQERTFPGFKFKKFSGGVLPQTSPLPFMRGILVTHVAFSHCYPPSNILSHRMVPFQKMPPHGKILKKGPGAARGQHGGSTGAARGQHGGSTGAARGQHGGSTGAARGQHGGSTGAARGQHGGSTGAARGQHGGSTGEARGQHGGSTGAARGQHGGSRLPFYQNCTSNVVRFSHELKLKTVFKQFSSYLNLNSSQKRYESVST